MSSPKGRYPIFLILHFLRENNFKETVHRLEQESGLFFDMKHFEEIVCNGEWDDVERYLSGFTNVQDNLYSRKIFFEIQKQKYLEALDQRDHTKAVEILMKDLKVFSTFDDELFKEMTQLITSENFRENEKLSEYGDIKSARNTLFQELKRIIRANPIFRDKLNLPTLQPSCLQTLISGSSNWQHHTRVTNPLLGAFPNAIGFRPFPAPPPGWMVNTTVRTMDFFPTQQTQPAVVGDTRVSEVASTDKLASEAVPKVSNR